MASTPTEHHDAPRLLAATQRRRWPIAAAGFAAGVLAMGAAVTVIDGSSGSVNADTVTADLTTVTATQQDLATYFAYDATLETAPSEPVASRSDGTITAAVPAGTTVEAGGVVAWIDGEPVAVVPGEIPFYRDLDVDAEDGPDIFQLEAFLAHAGFDPDAAITIDDEYTWDTYQAVARWQEAVGAEITGAVTTGSALAVGGTVVITEAAQVGETVRAADPLVSVSVVDELVFEIADGALASTTMAPRPSTVTLEVGVDEVTGFSEGQHVEIDLPSGDTTAGIVADVGTTATAQGEGQDDLTVAVNIDVADAGATVAGPVTVRIIDSEIIDATVVPTRALIGLAEGGVAVEVDDGTGIRQLVGVDTELFADGLVAITGDVAPGDLIVVPA